MKFSIDKLQTIFIRSLEKRFANKEINKKELEECLLILQLIEAEFILRKPIQSNNADVQDSSLFTVAVETKEEEFEIEVEVYLQLILNEIQQQISNNDKKTEDYELLIFFVHHYKRRWIDGEIN